MRDTRHLGRERGHGLTAAIGIARMAGHVSSELVAEAVVALARCRLRGHPKSAAQARVAVLRQLGAAPEGAGLAGGEVEAAELQELAVMTKAPEIASLR